MVSWLTNLFSPKRAKRKSKTRRRKSSKRKSRRKSRQRKSPKKRSRRRKSPMRDTLKKKIKSADWFIVTMKGCGYCGDAKKILRSRGQKYKTIVLTDKNEKEIWAVTDKIAKKKYRYFPMIFRKGKFVGGYGELKEKYSR